MSSHLILSQRAAQDVRSMQRQLEDAEYVLDRALGRAVSAIVGERVIVKPAHLQRPNQKHLTFQIVEVINTGQIKMLVLKDDGGRFHKYFRANELLPAVRRTTTETTREEVGNMTAKNASDELMQLSNAIMKSRRVDLRTALREASRQRPDLAEAHISGNDTGMVTQPTPVANATGDALLMLANQIAREQCISLRDALKVAAGRNVIAVQQYQERFNCGGLE